MASENKILSAGKSKKAFTLIEILAATSIMVLLLGSVLVVVGTVIQIWDNTKGRVEGSYEGDVLANFIEQDLQSMVIKRDGKAWFQVEYPGNVGDMTGEVVGSRPMRPPQLMFFSPTYIRPRFDSEQLMTRSTERKPVPGSVCAVKYQMSYKNPFRQGTSNEASNAAQENAFYGLYRAVIDSRSTFEEVLGEKQGDIESNEYALQNFWSGTCTVLMDNGKYARGTDLKSWVLSPENFISQNLVDLQITFAVMYKEEKVVRKGESPYTVAYIPPGVSFTVADKLYIRGQLYKIGEGGGRVPLAPRDVENGFLAFAELSMTFLSDAGVVQVTSARGEDATLEAFQEARQKFGTTISRKIEFIVNPVE